MSLDSDERIALETEIDEHGEPKIAPLTED